MPYLAEGVSKSYSASNQIFAQREANMMERSVLAKGRPDRRGVPRPRFRRGLPVLVVAVMALLGCCFPVFANADPDASPVITTVSPNDGPPSGGTLVTISGTGFSQATAVDFGSVPAESFSIDSDTSITAVSPPQAGYWGVVDVTVTGPDGASGTGAQDKFGYGPILDEMSPRNGPAIGGTEVTLRGFGLEGATEINFGGSPASSSRKRVMARSPPSLPHLPAEKRSASLRS